MLLESRKIALLNSSRWLVKKGVTQTQGQGVESVKRMRVPLELEHLVRSASDIPARSTLSTHLAAIESRKALEVEHYLRACAIRLEYEESSTHNNGP